MAKALRVISEFSNYKIGDTITDQEAIGKIVASDQASFVVSVNVQSLSDLIQKNKSEGQNQ